MRIYYFESNVIIIIRTHRFSKQIKNSFSNISMSTQDRGRYGMFSLLKHLALNRVYVKNNIYDNDNLNYNFHFSYTYKKFVNNTAFSVHLVYVKNVRKTILKDIERET